ncbi:ileal sodium/bile acid cotransporter-like [Sitodiplosis mosellana]|uniref:ileal sodium/bile acid cotransporter-like n=1 Tax=Sitodiplosis mosellana TaxID=263140 RepID=UPI002444CC7A|nr:ileal sodium/bile acid cotransporter-like [Sitodiplosis mosellana]XP_055299334.1 ileal sodium/bile acid cotransporter-like [Sitodiplosis mosellana]
MAVTFKDYVLVVSCLFTVLLTTTTAWEVNFEPNPIKMHMQSSQTVNFTLTGLRDVEVDYIQDGAIFNITSDSGILKVIAQSQYDFNEMTDGNLTGYINITADFLGTAKIYANITFKGVSQKSNESLHVVIIREERTIDHVFTASIVALVSILYINFGAALDLGKVKEILVRPIGPLIAFVCQFLFMPLLSYVLGMILFPNNVEMQLGLFFTGVSPSGGASNIWSVILGGNLDLSISMTTISTFSAFAMMPIWIFTLGTTIFDRGELQVPYKKIGIMAVGLIVPLIIGLLIQRYLPRLAKVLVRILKTCSSLLIIFIIIFAIVTNLYLFELFTWQIIVAGLGLPWIAYIVGWTVAKCFKQKHEDCVAISIEAGIQNTGISIFILRLALAQPQGDLTTVIPVSVALMTPVPLLFYYIYLKGKDRFSKHRRGAVPVPTNPSGVAYSVGDK